MKTEKDIVKEAVESYETHFTDAKETPDDAYRGHDVVIDKEGLTKEMEAKKLEEEKKEEEREHLKEELTNKAEDALHKTFGDK